MDRLGRQLLPSISGRCTVTDQRWIVRVHGVHRYFKRGSERLDVLNDLTLNVPEGEFFGLMGPSGSGKTTLLNLIAGLDSQRGRSPVGEELISSMSEGQLARWRTRTSASFFSSIT